MVFQQYELNGPEKLSQDKVCVIFSSKKHFHKDTPNQFTIPNS